MKDFFKGLKVVEFASVLAGPSVGQFFAELGAEVIKIENQKTAGDVTRSWKLASEDAQHPFSAYYSSVNYGKQSVFLDLKSADDLAKAHEWVKEASIVIVNFKSGDAEKLGLDFERLKALNPALIYGEISGFGSSKRVAYDIVLQAESGFLSMSGTQNGELCKMPVALIDLLAAHQLKEGLLLAMLQQQKEAKAIKVSVSLLDAAVSSLANQATNFLMAQHIAQPLGTLHPNIAPYGELFRCKDEKQIVLAIASNAQFEKLCHVLKITHVLKNTQYNSNQNRVKHRQELAMVLEDKIQERNRDELLNQLIAENIPAGAVRSIKEVFDLEAVQNRIRTEKKEGHTLKSLEGNAFVFSY